jgi:hypothetical protein
MHALRWHAPCPTFPISSLRTESESVLRARRARARRRGRVSVLQPPELSWHTGGHIHRKSLISSNCPTWIRTMNEGSKGLCVTVTPSGKELRISPQRASLAIEKSDRSRTTALVAALGAASKNWASSEFGDIYCIFEMIPRHIAKTGLKSSGLRSSQVRI